MMYIERSFLTIVWETELIWNGKNVIFGPIHSCKKTLLLNHIERLKIDK